MRRVSYNYDDPVIISSATIPRPGRGEVLVKISCAGVNPVDAKNVFGDKLPNSTICHSFARWWVHSYTPGFDFSGVIEEVGSGVNTWRKGDKVFGTVPPFVGTFAEYTVVPVDQIQRMPSNLEFEDAACVPLGGLTCLQSMERYNVRESSHVLVIGASGGTGHLAIQIAKAFGARVVGICSSKNTDFVSQYGIDTVLNYDAGDLMERLVGEVNQHGCFTFVLDTVTSADPRDCVMNYQTIFQQSSVKLFEGNYVRLGGPSLSWIAAGLKRTIGLNFFPKESELFWVRFPESEQELDRLRRMIEEKKLKPFISRIYPFTEDGVRDAFLALKERRNVGKIVIQVCLSQSTIEK